eukprot:m.53497 g.53497  ORF g.53497 m.53497 type:complete len:612 (-) comp10869_c0_seq2:1609-3444(-)
MKIQKKKKYSPLHELIFPAPPLMLGFVALIVLLTAGSQVMTDIWLILWTDEYSHNHTFGNPNFYHQVNSSHGYSRMSFAKKLAPSIHLHWSPPIWLAMTGFGAQGAILGMLIYILVSMLGALSRYANTSKINKILQLSTMFPLTTKHENMAVQVLAGQSTEADFTLPRRLWYLLFSWNQALCAMAFISIILPWFSIFVLVILITVRSYQQRYVKSWLVFADTESRQERRLLADMRGVLKGLNDLGSASQRTRIVANNFTQLDTLSTCALASSAMQRWVEFRLDMFGCAVLFLAGCLEVLCRDSVSPGFTGPLVLYALSLAEGFSCIAHSRAHVELSAACLHVREETTTALEVVEARAANKRHLPIMVNWPEKGTVSFQGVTLYDIMGSLPVVDRLSFTIHTGERVCFVSKAGGGKSSIGGLMLGSKKPSRGKVLIDDVDISTVSMDALRSSVAYMSQNLTLLKGTVRQNLDPCAEHSEEELMEVLGDLKLINQLMSSRGLHTMVLPGGANFSELQRASLCVARILLQRPRMVVLDNHDEICSSETATFVTEKVLKGLPKSTVLCVTDRIGVALLFDKIYEMENGEIKRIADTQSMLRDTTSYLYEMHSLNS